MPTPLPSACIVVPFNTKIPATAHVSLVPLIPSVISQEVARNSKFTIDFGNPGSPYNIVQGFGAAHTYTGVGPFTLTVTMENPNLPTQVFVHTFNVEARTPAKLIYVSPAGNDNNPGTEALPIKTVTQANTLLGTLSNVRIMFKCGGTYPYSTSSPAITISGTEVYIGRYGNVDVDPDPIILRTGTPSGGSIISLNAGANNTIIAHIQFDSEGTDEGNSPVAIRPAAAENTTIRNCKILRLASFVIPTTKPKGILLSGNSTVGTTVTLQGYFAFVTGSYWSILGNTVNGSVAQHNIRTTDVAGTTEEATGVTIAYNDLKNETKTTINIRSGSYFYLYHNTCSRGAQEVGEISIGQDAGRIATDTWIDNVVLDSNVVDSLLKFSAGAKNIVVRNNRMTTSLTTISESTRLSGYNGNSTNPYPLVGPALKWLENIKLQFNTFQVRSLAGKGVKLQGWSNAGEQLVRGYEFNNNLMVVPAGWEVGGSANGTNVALNIQAPNLNECQKMKDNVWPDVVSVVPNQPGAIHYVALSPNLIVAAGWKNHTEWNAMNPPVVGERFENWPLDIYGNPLPQYTGAGAWILPIIW